MMSNLDNELKDKFQKIEVTQVEKFNNKVSSALVVGVVVGAIGVGYKVSKALLKMKRK